MWVIIVMVMMDQLHVLLKPSLGLGPHGGARGQWEFKFT